MRSAFLVRQYLEQVGQRYPAEVTWCVSMWPLRLVRYWVEYRGGRYIDEKLSKADKSVFLKLSATYRYRKMEILKLSKNYRYRKMHQILADK